MLVTWKVYTMPSATRSQAGSRVMSRPRNSTRPDVGRSRPQSMLTSVVLPAPFGPMRARISPGSIRKSTSRTAWRPANARERTTVSRSAVTAATGPTAAGCRPRSRPAAT